MYSFEICSIALMLFPIMKDILKGRDSTCEGKNNKALVSEWTELQDAALTTELLNCLLFHISPL